MILRRKVLRSVDSSPENLRSKKKIPGGGKFFAGAFFARMILRWRILRYSYFFVRAENSSPENFSPGSFFARSILRRIILRSKKSLKAENSSPESYRYFFVRAKNSLSDNSLLDFRKLY
jgi:hypothetical protein